MAPKKIIIDTDPGVDDSWAILLALRSPEVEVIGLTSLFGNVRTTMATANSLKLLETFGQPHIPVVEGSLVRGWGEERRLGDLDAANRRERMQRVIHVSLRLTPHHLQRRLLSALHSHVSPGGYTAPHGAVLSTPGAHTPPLCKQNPNKMYTTCPSLKSPSSRRVRRLPYIRTTIAGGSKERIADFVHGDDGFGNTNQPPPKGKAMVGKTAAQFIVDKANEFPGEVTVVALASATNVTLALRLDPTLKGKLKEVVHLGGAFFVNGNVNPAAEANIFGDPEAADELYG
jgi:hypothetical protein